jgi:hypothetical protein
MLNVVMLNVVAPIVLLFKDSKNKRGRFQIKNAKFNLGEHDSPTVACTINFYDRKFYDRKLRLSLEHSYDRNHSYS